MKKIVLLIGIITLVLAASQAFSQGMEGVITYESKTNLHRRLPPEREEMKKMMPQFRTSKEQLFFNATESVYKPVIEDDLDELDNGGGMRVQIARPYFEFYLNSESKTATNKREFMGKNYLITKSMEIAPWKFSDETKIILGYECKQAYYTTEDGQTITAWYTDKLRAFLGPNTYYTLPGAILALDINNEEQVYEAKQIELKALKNNEMKIPKGGQETTDDEFKIIVDEQMKKMGAHGGMIIRN
ncbi:MAG: GLPGLI family protein [Cyclobacteriaceae bacterium]